MHTRNDYIAAMADPAGAHFEDFADWLGTIYDAIQPLVDDDCQESYDQCAEDYELARDAK